MEVGEGVVDNDVPYFEGGYRVGGSPILHPYSHRTGGQFLVLSEHDPVAEGSATNPSGEGLEKSGQAEDVGVVGGVSHVAEKYGVGLVVSER